MKWVRRQQPASADDASEQQLRQVEADKKRRMAQTATQRDLVADVSRILFEADLIGISYETNTDEYDPEAETIVIRLPRTHNPAEVQALAHETFVQWFGSATAGSAAHYSGVAAEIWNAWLRHDGRRALL